MRFRSKKILALVMSLTLAMGIAGYGYADDLQDKIDDAQSKLDDAEAAVEALQNEKYSAQVQLNALNAQLDELNAKIEETQAAIDVKVQEIKIAEDEYVQAKLQEEQQYEAMKKRIKYMYEYSLGDEIMTAMLTSQDISDLVSKTEYFSSMTTYDKAMNEKYQALVEEVAAREAALQAEYDELVALQEELAANQEMVYALIEQQEALIAQLAAEIGAGAAAVEELKEQVEDYKKQKEQREEAARAAAYNGTSFNPSGAGANNIVGTGEFCNPCPSGRLSSGFGYRSFDNSFHKGIDLAAPTGSPVYAAYDGTVLISCYSASAGNWVVISHGNGLVTKYMHNSCLYVSAGQKVSKGQNIAAVGSTGYSTGPHCHFQVELGGAAVNPWNYL